MTAAALEAATVLFRLHPRAELALELAFHHC